MNYSSKKENQLLFNSYVSNAKSPWNVKLTEAEQAAVQGEELKREYEQKLQEPKTQEAMVKAAEQLKAKYNTQIQQALQKDGGKAGPAVEALLKQIQQELDAAAKQQVKESIDMVEEGFFDRVNSKVSGFGRRVGDWMEDRQGMGTSNHALMKRFDIMKKTIGKDLRELQRDLATTSNTDTSVKQAVDSVIATIEKDHGVAPVQSKLGDMRHAIGRGVQAIGTAGLMAAAIVPAAGALAGGLGLTGVAAAAATSGVTAGSVSMLKDMIDGQKPNVKRAVVAAGVAAAAGGLIKYGVDQYAAAKAGATNAPVGQTGTEGAAQPAAQPAAAAPTQSGSSFDMKSLFKQATDSTYNTVSNLDGNRMEVLNKIIDMNGKAGADLSQKQIADVFGRWSDVMNVGKGTTSANAVERALTSIEGKKALVKAFKAVAQGK